MKLPTNTAATGKVLDQAMLTTAEHEQKLKTATEEILKRSQAEKLIAEELRDGKLTAKEVKTAFEKSLDENVDFVELAQNSGIRNAVNTSNRISLNAFAMLLQLANDKVGEGVNESRAIRTVLEQAINTLYHAKYN